MSSMTTSPPSSALAYLESAANGEFIELLEEGNRLRVRVSVTPVVSVETP